MMRSLVASWSTASAMLVVAACSSTSTTTDSSDAAPCEDYSGTWKIDGCGVKECNIAQSGCSVSFACMWLLNIPFTSTGTAVGKEVSFDSTDLKCTLAVAGQGLVGDCTNEAGACTLNGTRL